jgi:Family of unknown function (DUF5326)
MKSVFGQLPVWVRWGVIPVLALLLFGGLIMTVIGFIVGLLFKALIFVALVAVVVFLAKRFTMK